MERKIETATHEAGHCLVAEAWSLTVEKVTIKGDGDANGRTIIVPPRSLARERFNDEGDMLGWLATAHAGAAAATKLRGYPAEVCGADLEHVDAVVRGYERATGRDAARLVEVAKRDAHAIVEARWGDIQRLAQNLLKHGTIRFKGGNMSRYYQAPPSPIDTIERIGSKLERLEIALLKQARARRAKQAAAKAKAAARAKPIAPARRPAPRAARPLTKQARLPAEGELPISLGLCRAVIELLRPNILRLDLPEMQSMFATLVDMMREGAEANFENIDSSWITLEDPEDPEDDSAGPEASDGQVYGGHARDAEGSKKSCSKGDCKCHGRVEALVEGACKNGLCGLGAYCSEAKARQHLASVLAPGTPIMFRKI